MEIRYASSMDDPLKISKVYEASWKYAYRGIIPQDYLDSIPEGRWASGFDNPNRKILVCAEAGRIVGTSSFCSSRFEQFSGWGEVIALYLLPEYMGKGYGKRLLETAVTQLRKQGSANVFLWVLEENHRARHFYERFGFLPTSDFLEADIGGKALREVRYIFQPRRKFSLRAGNDRNSQADH